VIVDTERSSMMYLAVDKLIFAGTSVDSRCERHMTVPPARRPGDPSVRPKFLRARAVCADAKQNLYCCGAVPVIPVVRAACSVAEDSWHQIDRLAT